MEDLVVGLTVKLRWDHKNRVCAGTRLGRRDVSMFSCFCCCYFSSFLATVLTPYFAWKGFILCVGCMCTMVLFSKLATELCPAKSRPLC